jgi:hypothetical protein
MKCATISAFSLSTCLLLLGAALFTASIPTAAAQPARPAVLRAQAAELEREAAELKEAGRHDEARELMRKVETLRAEFSRMQAERGGNQREPRAPREPRTPREPRFERPDAAEIERRAHHLEVAIDNLHAAGLHEPAERLAPQLERMRRHLEETRLQQPGQPASPDEVHEALRAQIGELHRIVRELRADIETLRRERRDP